MIHQHYPNIKTHDQFAMYRSLQKGKLLLTISITFAVMILEIIGGIFTNSIALMSDAGHMFTHVFALLISYGAIMCSSMEACHHRTYGFYRSEVLASLFNSIFLFGVTGFICWESIKRVIYPEPILSKQMFVIAVIGLVVNLVSIWILHGASGDRNIKSAVLHMFADAGSSVAIVIGAIIISLTGWNIVDPIISIGIALLILVWAWELLKDSINVLLETAPKGIMTDEVARMIEREIPHITVADIHIWEITSHMFSMTAHIVVNDMPLKESEHISDMVKKIVFEKYNIGHATIEVRTQ